MKELEMLVQDLRRGRATRRQFLSRATALGISLSSIEMLLQACGGSGSGGSKAGTVNITWSVWGNPGELKRFYEYTDDFNAKHPTIHAQLSPIPITNYDAKILTNLNGGVAPDVFYVMDYSLPPLVKAGQVAELSSLFKSSVSQSSPDDFYESLWGIGKTADGKIYGIPPDCNSIVLLYNIGVLQEAGVTQMPADLYAQGKWTRDEFTAMLEKVRAKGKHGYVLDNWNRVFYSWVTTNGGQVYSDNGHGKFIVNEDPRSVDAFVWLANGVRSKLITYASSLPRGQSNDVLFMANQVAFVSAGRWFVPEFKQVKGLQYDVVPFPTYTGKLIPAGAPGDYMVLNSKSKHLTEAFAFLSAFTSKAGQQFRLSGQGNALPSIKGIDQLVLADKQPAHAQYFLDTRNIEYTLLPAEARIPSIYLDIQSTLDTVWVQGADVRKTLNTLADMVNKKLAQAQA